MLDSGVDGGSSQCKPDDPGEISVFSFFRRFLCCIHLGALFDGRGDMVEADRAL